MFSVMEIAMKEMGSLIEIAKANMKVLPGPIVNVTGYGATGNGVTDDTQAVQSAIDYATTNGMRTIFFPHGTYRVTSLTNADQLLFIGDNSSFVGGYSGSIYPFGTSTTGIEKLNFKNATTLTIASGVVTVTQSYHSVDTEASAAVDDLDTINGGNVGDELILRGISSARTVTIKNATGNIYTFDGLDIVLTNGNRAMVRLIKMASTQWVVMPTGVSRLGDTLNGSLLFASSAIDQGITRNRGGTGENRFSFDFTGSAEAIASVSLFRNTVTSGTRKFDIFAGDGSATAAFRIENGMIKILNGVNVTITAGTGSPEGVMTANPGSLYLNISGGAGTTHYEKRTGTGNTGWVGK